MYLYVCLCLVWEVCFGMVQRRQEMSCQEKLYVLGRREQGDGGLLCLGRYHALDGSCGAPVYVDALHPHVVLICGKRGYGKSYTIGVVVEELARLEPEVRRHLGVVVVDTLGIFWTMAYGAGRKPGTNGGEKNGGIPVRLFVPQGAVERARGLGVRVLPYAVRVADLSASSWCRMFSVSPLEPVGIVLSQAVEAVRERSSSFSLFDLQEWLERCSTADPLLRSAAGMLFSTAASWGIFSEEGVRLEEIVRPGEVTVLDLSYLQSHELKDVVVALLADGVFDARVMARKAYEQERLGLEARGGGMPMVWLAVDEAQVFLPAGGGSRCREVLVGKWMRQGRQPGLSLVMATQRPSAIDEEVFAHSDLVICHRVTAQEDLDALARIRPQYLAGDIGGLIRQLGLEKGVAVLLDDTSESAHVVRVRQRLTWHAGEESVALQPGVRR
jgi:uncharacterized protein